MFQNMQGMPLGLLLQYDLIHLQSPHLQAMLSAVIGKILGKPVVGLLSRKRAFEDCILIIVVLRVDQNKL